MSITQNYNSLLTEVKTLNPQAEIVVVTKTQPIESTLEAIEAGATILGENRIQEAEDKFPRLPSSISKHLIGHLQKNKVNKAVKLFDLIETVDSYPLAEKINQACEKLNKSMPIFIQVNTSEEEQKSGIEPEKTVELIKKCAQLKHIQITGLMTIAKLSQDSEEQRKCFQSLKLLYNKVIQLNIKNVELKHLSMGMSNDYQIALEEGSTLVRIGTGIFGKRD